MGRINYSLLVFILLFLELSNLSHAQNPDAIYPVPTNYGEEITQDINLFSGNINKKVTLYKLEGAGFSYDLVAFYNSSSANMINQDASNYVPTPLGGYGWKIADYPKIVQDTSGYYLVDENASHLLQSTADGKYVAGGEKYIWNITKGSNNWHIAKGDGTHFYFDEAADTTGGVSIWNFTKIKSYSSSDSLSFFYENGLLTEMTNTSGDTITLSYCNSPVTGNPLLTELNHTLHSNQIARIIYGYKKYTFSNKSYELLSEIDHYHQISALHYSQKEASIRFDYLEPGETPPLGGDSYLGALTTVTDPSGAISIYTYQNLDSAGVSTFRVVQLAVNDGYANNSGGVFDPYTYNAIAYDDSNFLNGADEVYRFYNRVSLARGGRFNAADSLTHPYGNVEYYFLNGQTATNLLDLPVNYPTESIQNVILKGQVYQKKVNSDSTVSNSLNKVVAIQNYWDVGYRGSGNIGGFPKLLKTYDEKYGIGKWMTYQYGTTYQLPVSVSTSRRNPDPTTTVLNKDSVVTKLTYAFQHYPQLVNDDIYLMHEVGKYTQLVQANMTGSFNVTECNCTQWTQWSTDGLPNDSTGYWASARKVIMRSALADTTNCLSASMTNSNWLVTEEINRRGTLRSPVQYKDESGTAISFKLSVEPYGVKPITAFKNSLVGSSSANSDQLGFERYEPSYTQKWTATEGGINTNYAHTGSQSFSGTLSRTFSPSDDKARTYKLGVWTKVASNGDSCIIQLKHSENILAISSASYEPGESSLRYLEIGTLVTPGMNITAELSTSGNAFIDDVTFMPVDAQMQTTVYDIDRNTSIAQLGVNGATTHLVRNRFNSLVAEIGPGSIQNVNNLTIPYNSRRGNKFINGIDTFNTVYPNMMLITSAKNGGNWQGFEYATNGSFPAQNLVNMSIQNGWLQATSTEASATYSHTTDTANMAFYTEIFPNDVTSGEEIGLSLQLDSYNYNDSLISTQEIKFVMTRDSLKLYSDSTVYKSIPIADVLNSTSLFLSVSDYNHVLCYANGRYVFDHEFTLGQVRGPVKLITNNTGGAFDNFIYIVTPDIEQLTYDALNRPKQRLKRINKDQIGISEILYGGPQDLPSAQTRDAIIGGGGAGMAMSYKEGFVSGFDHERMTISDTCTLGSAANYDNPFSHSVQYGKNPLTQIESVGGGGQFTAGENGNHYTRFSYGDDAGRIFNYQSAELLINSKTEPNGVLEINYYNREEVHFATARIDGVDTLKTQYQYDNRMRLVKIFNPNYFNNQLTGHDHFTRTFEYDFLGNRIREKNPDEGTKHFVYNPDGKLRFSIDSVGLTSDTNQIVYAKYDALGRITEQGVINKTWNRDSLQYYADNYPDYPSTSNPDSTQFYWRRRFTYDGDGMHFRQGKLVQTAVNCNDDQSAEVKETFEYDEYNNIIEKGLKTTDFDTLERKVTYAYNLDNRITQIDFPGTSHPGVTYTYDGKGQTIAVGIPGDEDYYASYEYGYETIEYLNNGNFMRTYSKNNAGWITEINDPLFNETLSYEHYTGTEDSTYNYNGKIAELSDKKKWSGLMINGSFTYDNNGRIKRADFGAVNPWSLGLSTPVSYDQNGNILQMQRGTTAALTFEYNAGTNQTQTIQGFTEDYSYDGNGAITAVPYGVSDISYDPLSLLTSSISYNNLTVNYQYNGQNQRVLKTVNDSSRVKATRLYVHGLNDYPLMEIDKDSTGTSRTTLYIYGPMGLIAAQQEEERLFMLKDHLGSIRVVIDTTSTVKAYFDYSTFGATTESYIDPSISHFALSYRFTGQEIEPELGGLYNFRARMYDPGTGRFYSPDPLMQYPSPYDYVGDNPINRIDPTGEWSWFSTIVTAVAAVVVTAAVIVAAPVVLPTAIAASAVGTAVAATAVGTVVGTAVGTASGTLHDHDSFGSSLVHAAGISFVASAATAGIAYASGGINSSAVTARFIARNGRTLRNLSRTIEFRYYAADGYGGHVLNTSARNLLRSSYSGLITGIGAGALMALMKDVDKNTKDVDKNRRPTPPPIQATNDGINCCEEITASDLKITGRSIEGGFAAKIDLSKASVFVNDDSYECNREYCDGDKYPNPPYTGQDTALLYAKYSQRILKNRAFSGWKYMYPSWSETIKQTLYINGGFFFPLVDSYQESCTSNQGIWVANNKVINSTFKNSFWQFKGESSHKYYLDAIVFYKYPDALNGKYVEIVKYDSIRFFQSSFLRDSVQNGIGGVYFLRNGQDYSSQLPPGVLAREARLARLALGVTDDGKYLHILQIDDKNTGGESGITFSEAVPWFISKGCNNAIMLDGSASSQLYYSLNGRTYQSRPMEIMSEGQEDVCRQRKNLNGIQQYRPIMQFIGFK